VVPPLDACRAPLSCGYFCPQTLAVCGQSRQAPGRGRRHEFGYSGAALYSHFGQGCVHTRIPFDLVTADGIAAFRRFIERAADLVASYGGSFPASTATGSRPGIGRAAVEVLERLAGG